MMMIRLFHGLMGWVHAFGVLALPPMCLFWSAASIAQNTGQNTDQQTTQPNTRQWPGELTLTGKAAIARLAGNTLIFWEPPYVDEAGQNSKFYMRADGAMIYVHFGVGDRPRQHHWSSDDDGRLCLSQFAGDTSTSRCMKIEITGDRVVLGDGFGATESGGAGRGDGGSGDKDRPDAVIEIRLVEGSPYGS